MVAKGAFIYIMALVFASDVHQIKAFMTPANVASKSIDAVPKSWADNPPSSTFINIYTSPAIRPKLQPWRRTAAAHLPFQHVTAILAVCHQARKGI